VTDNNQQSANPFTLKAILLVLTYWVFQSIAATIFKIGSMHEELWMTMFWCGHLFGASSIAFMMILYRTMHPNVALGICFGGAFLCAQVTMAVVFNSILTPVQWIGLFSMTGGMAALSMGGDNNKTAATEPIGVVPSADQAEPSVVETET
jgi:hypothetical protein